MIVECRDYLIQKLRTAGIKTKVCTSMKDLKSFSDSHVGAVIPDGESFQKAYSKKVYQTDSGDKHKRRKLFDRELTFVVVIGENDYLRASEIFDRFMGSLDTGIVINGNYTEIIVPEADWVDKNDSILNSQIAVQIQVKFMGGIYRDTDFAKVSNYEIRSIEQED
ncbi:SON protein [Paenibacillus sp. M1]|uniref:SON protein n=1 Tax=Paenibacillus haidiansis TaxID=1574488 RepID=A0ABU7VY00_9BACL